MSTTSRVEIPKQTQTDTLLLQDDIEIDLIAYYKTLCDRIQDAVDENADKSLDEIVHEIGMIL